MENKITKVNDNVINYRGFYFSVRRNTTFNGSVKSIEYHGLNAGMKNVYWNREELKRCVDRRINNAIKLYCEWHEMSLEDNPNLNLYLNMGKSVS
jgi:hypothetical protein